MSLTEMKKRRRIAKPRLAAASAIVLESMERRVMMTALSTISYGTAGSTYSQNFDTLPATASAAATLSPNAFDLGTSTTPGNTNLAGWSVSDATALKFATLNDAAGGTSVTTGAINNYALATDTSHRALGMVSTTSSGVGTIAAEFVNNTGSTINQVNISYLGEQWHEGTASGSKALNVGYVVTGAAGTTGAQPPSVTNVAALKFTSPITNQAGTELDGTASANQTQFTNVPLSSLNWGNGQVLWVTWTMDSNTTQGAGLAIDNFNLTSVPTATPPTITQSPTSQEVATGATVVFTAAATGTPTPTVQWNSEAAGASAFTPDTTDSGNQTTSLSVVASAANNGTQYEAVFTSNSLPATTNPATLTVDSPPVITTQPTAVNTTSGNTATFTAAASGTPTPTVQWQSSPDGVNNWTDVPSGGTSATYSFTASASQSGTYYRARFSNSQASNVPTNAVKLTVSGSIIDAWNFNSLVNKVVNTSPAPSSSFASANTGSASSIGMSAGGASVLVGSQTSGTFTLTITDSNGAHTTGNITYSSTAATMASNIQTALQALTGVAGSGPGGFTATTISGAAAAAFTIGLSGDASAVLSGGNGSALTTPGNFSAQPAPAFPTPGATGPDLSAGDVTAGSSDGSTGLDWKVVGNNGWENAAGIGTQGAQFLVPTTGFQNVQLQFDWGVASQKANGQLAVEYTLNGGSTWAVAPTLAIPSADSLTELSSNSTNSNIVSGSYFQNIGSSSWQNKLTADFSSISGATNNPNFGIRLVNAATGAAVVGGAAPVTPTAASESGNTVTITAATGTGGQAYTVGDSVTVAGVSQTGYNGSYIVTAVGSGTFSYTSATSGLTSLNSAALAGATVIGGPSQTSSNWRFDEVQISGTQIPAAPTISTIADQTTVAGSSATFTATVSGFPTPSIQWYKGTQPNFDYTNSSQSTLIPNATSPSYTTPATAATDNNTYYEAVATNNYTGSGNTSVASNSAKLTVQSIPSITASPSSETVGVGGVAKFTAAATGNPTPSVDWQVSTDGGHSWITLSDNSTYSGTATTTLTVNVTESLTNDQFRAQFSNSADGNVPHNTSAATLTVTGTALAQWVFSGQSVFNGTSVPADTNPAPTVGPSGTTLTPLGMSNSYNQTTSTDAEDVIVSPTASTNPAAANFQESTYRIRGTTTNANSPLNGWSNAAPEYTQGAEVDVPASGYNNFSLSFDWYSTSQGIRDLQVQYFDPVSNAWTNAGTPYIASANDFYGVNTGITPGTGVPTPVSVNLQGIADLASVSVLKLRMVSAYDPSLPLLNDGNTDPSVPTYHGQYASATTGLAYQQQELNFSNVTASQPTFTLTYNNPNFTTAQNTTTPIAYSNAGTNNTGGAASAIQSALNLLPAISAVGGVTVVSDGGTPTAAGAPDPYTVIFADASKAALYSLTADPTNLSASPGDAVLDVVTASSNGMTSATSTTGTVNGVIQYNNNSGNWRFDNITVSGDVAGNYPGVVAQPVNETWVTQGVSQTPFGFTASAYSDTQSTDLIKVQWQSASKSNPTSFTNVGGLVATTISGGYSVANLQLNPGNDTSQDGTVYRAEFYNTSDTGLAHPATTNGATLSVVPPVAATVSVNPVSVTVLNGGTAVFTASETGGSPAPTVIWQESDASGNFPALTATTSLPSGAVETPSSTTATSTSTLTFVGVKADSGRLFRAVFTNAEGSVATNTATSAALTVLQPETTVARWSFPTVTAAPYNSPAQTSNSDHGGPVTPGDTNPADPQYLGGSNYAGATNFEGKTPSAGAQLTTIGFPVTNPVAGSSTITIQNDNPDDDVALTAGTASSAFYENLWRVRNTASNSSTAQGWDQSAPDKSQGFQISVDTTGYANVYATFDWYATTQGIRDLQREYSIDGGQTWNLLGAPLAATSNDYYGANAAAGVSHVPVIFDLTGIAAANNNPNVQLRAVSTYDPTVLNSSGQPFEYTAAAVPANGVATKYNGTSGNWRFGNISVEALPSWLSPTSAASYDPSTNTLTVSGPATIISDPGADTTVGPTAEPTIVASGALASLTFAPVIPSGSSTAVTTDFHIGGLTLSGGATADVASLGSSRTANNHDVLVIGTANAVSAPAFSIDAVHGSKLDMEDNDLIIHEFNLSDTGLQADVAAGRDGGLWDGNGLTSSTAAAANANLFFGSEVVALAVTNYNDLSQVSSITSWNVGKSSEAFSSDGNDVIVKYTYVSDFDLSGQVDGSDIGIINNYYDPDPTDTFNNWVFGDTDNNGTVDASDIGVINNAYGSGTSDPSDGPNALGGAAANVQL